jgi:hypothetical protein
MAVDIVRNFEGNMLTSTAMPAIKVKVAHDLAHVGRLQFVLYGVADVDFFVFVGATPEKLVKRFLLVQFEGYLETNTHTYSYPETETVTLNGQEYMHDTFAYPLSAGVTNPESDSAHMMGLIMQGGYTLPEEFISTRFVRLLDNNRKEILFSYGEDLSEYGYRASEISEEWRLLPTYPALESDILAHALDAFEVVESDS